MRRGSMNGILSLCPLWISIFLLFQPVWAGEGHPPSSGKSSSAVPLYSNLGTHHHPITTASPKAQQYFDQGMRLIYAFNHNEAIRAFKEALRLDPDCALCYWGIALALGPNINLPMEAKQEAEAFEVIQKALGMISRLPEAERAYILALSRRYALPAGSSRAARDAAYADAMREVARRYPKDTDAATLFAEALMDISPWDYWTSSGEPKSRTAEIVSTLEKALKQDPNHPGACHYYIHAVEASPQPEQALPCATRLPDLMPGAGHLVHMPAHIYMRLGRYRDAVASNLRAVQADERYIEGQRPQGFYPMVYYPHNLHFLWAAAMMEGQSGEALQTARELLSKVPESAVREMPPLEMFTPTVLFTLARFGKWDDILEEPSPPENFRYAAGVWHYVRGLAHAASNRPEEAAGELKELSALADAIPPDQVVGLNSSASLLRIAQQVLAGEMASRKGEVDEAVRQLEEAVRLQDNLIYDEPPPWYYPVRQSLGAVLLTAGRAVEAEKVYREDLRRNPENGWSLFGLAESLRVQKSEKESEEISNQFRKAWERADVSLTASRF